MTFSSGGQHPSDGDQGHLLNPSATILLQTPFPTPLHSTQCLSSKSDIPLSLEHPKVPKHICLGVAKALLPLLNDNIIQESLLDTYKQKHRMST